MQETVLRKKLEGLVEYNGLDFAEVETRDP